jgi:ferredoxin-type protein NapH
MPYTQKEYWVATTCITVSTTMKRQRTRFLILLISVILFPITIYYHSPALIIQGAAEGIVTGSFLLFLAQFLSAIFLGRAFCGWVCAGGGIARLCKDVNNKQVAGGKANWIKWYIWLPWMALITYFAIQAGGFSDLQPLYLTWNGISVHEPQSYIIYYFFVALIAGLSIFIGRRAFCHYVCWMAPFMIIGARVGAFLKIPRLRLKVDAEKCKQCHSCDFSCPMSLPVSKMVGEGAINDQECILCGSCVDTCTTSSIQFTFAGEQKANNRQ